MSVNENILNYKQQRLLYIIIIIIISQNQSVRRIQAPNMFGILDINIGQS